MKRNERGFFAVFFALGFVLITSLGLVTYQTLNGNPPNFLADIINKNGENQQENKLDNNSNLTQTSTPSSTDLSEVKIRTTTLPRTPTPKPFSKAPTLQKTTTPPIQQTNTPAIKHNTCTVSTLADSSSEYGVWLSAGANITNGSYITGAQWDFDGNGSWDTEMNISNQNITKNYSQSGTYTVKLKTAMSDGSVTDVCNKSVTIPFGFTVSLSGVVYEDINCNDMREPGEKGLGNVKVGITNMDGYSTLATLTTDSEGKYNFTYVLAGNNAITVKPYDWALDGYGVMTEGEGHQITLNSAQRSINMDLGQVPAPVGDYCGF